MSGDERAGAPVPDPIFEPSAADEVTDELNFHVDMRTRELIAQGIAPEIARRMARDRFADIERVTQECHHLAQRREHAAKRTRYLINFAQDIHFSLRMLRRRPAFALLAIATIGLGIGAATAIYSVVDGVMLRPLPFADPGKLVAVWVTEERFRTDATLNTWWDHIVMGQEDYDAIRARTRSVRDVALWGHDGVVLTTPDGPVPLASIKATANLLGTLRLRPALGRAFLPGEDVLNGPAVAMVSWEEWQSRWRGDSSLIGRSIQLGAGTRTVVGVLPRGLRLDRSEPIAPIWVPALQDSNDIATRHNRGYDAVARLQPGATLQQATAEISRILSDVAIASRGPVRGKGVAARVEQLQVDQTRTVRASLWILFGAVVLLLLIACVNVATLMLGEAARREPEIGARAALGASSGRIARQLLTESLAIAALGAVLGVIVAAASVRVLVAMAPTTLPGIGDVRLDWRVLTFASGCALATGLLFGLAPVLMMLRRAQRTSIRTGTGQTARGSRSLQHGLIAFEIGLSLILLTGCLLLGRSLNLITNTMPGFDPENVAVLQLLQQRPFWSDDERVRRFADIASRELALIPGVTAVTATSNAPFDGGRSSSPVKSDGREYAPDEPGANAQQRTILPNYFAVMKIPVLAGRAFNESDRKGNGPVIIVSEAEARRDWPGMSPIGRRLHWQSGWRTVVGIVRDVKYTQLSRPDEPTIYVPMDQSPSTLTLVLRTRVDGTPLDRIVRERIKPIDAAVSASAITTMRSLISKSYGEERYRTLLASLFGLLASVLATVGIFGVVSRAVARRMRESGIRMALGAPAAALTRLLMRETMVGLAIGLAVGMPAAWLVARLLAPYLFGVTPGDPVAFGAAIGLLLIAGGAATLHQARRAANIDPVVVLRSE